MLPQCFVDQRLLAHRPARSIGLLQRVVDQVLIQPDLSGSILRLRADSPFIYLAPVPDSQHENEHQLVLDRTDEPVIAHATAPEFAEFGAVERLSDAPRVVELGDSLMKKLQDAPRDLGISLSSRRSASCDSSIFQAMFLHRAFEGNGFAAACADILKRGLGHIHVF